jgi:hypothetical protein
MQTVSYTEIENAEQSDIGKIALYCLGGATLAIENTLDECIKTAEDCTGEKIGDIDTHTDHAYLTTADLVAVIVGPAE